MKNCNTCAHSRPTAPRCVGGVTGGDLTKIIAWLERGEAAGTILPGRVVTDAAKDCPGYLGIASAPLPRPRPAPEYLAWKQTPIQPPPAPPAEMEEPAVQLEWAPGRRTP